VPESHTHLVVHVDIFIMPFRVLDNEVKRILYSIVFPNSNTIR